MGRRCSEREMQSPDFIGLSGDVQVWGARRVGTLPWVLLNQQNAVKLVIFWVHNLRPSPGGMRPARHWKYPTNGTPNSLRATVIKDFRPGLQIRPRRFDSGFGLHLRKPRRSRSAGFFYGCAKGGCIPQNEAEGCRLVHKVIDERIIVSVITVGKQEHSAVYNQAKKR